MANRGGVQRPNVATQGKICQFRLVLLGESEVGKTSLVSRFVKGQFHEYKESTIGSDFLTQTVCLDDTTVKFEFWDAVGEERYYSMAPLYYRGAHAAIVMYDITSEDTYLSNKRAVEQDEAQAYADENGLAFMEMSAKTAINVNHIFLAIAKKLLKTDPTGVRAGGAGSGRRGVERCLLW